jgi:hypothetical protein
LQSQGVSDEEINTYIRHHHHDSVIHRHKKEVKAAVEQHPEVQRFLEWKDKYQASVLSRGGQYAAS